MPPIAVSTATTLRHERGKCDSLPLPGPAALNLVPPIPAGPPRRQALEFESLLAFTNNVRVQGRFAYTTQAELYRTFTAILPSVRVVSFDIFDTALVRYVDHPVDVFFHLEQHPAFTGHSFAQPPSKLRIAAEKAARLLVNKRMASHEANLLEIYEVFCDLNGISREYAAGFVDAEEQIELRLCARCPAIQRLCTDALAAGKRVIFVSDTYHHTPFLVRLLEKVGYSVSPDTVFASSAARKAKQSGDLFPQVIAAVGFLPAEILHLGDHPISDFERARGAGLQAILHSQKPSREYSDLLAAKGGPKLPGDDSTLSQKSMLRGLRHMTAQTAETRGHGENFWWKFGYASAGPLTVGFCQWLEQSLRADGMEHAYFLLRDGELLYKVYDALYRNKLGACPASPLDSSRRAMLLPVLEMAPAFALPSLLGGIGARPVREYLDRLGVSADGFEAEARASGFASLDQLVDGRFDTNRLVSFLVQKPVLTAILERSRMERETLTVFLDRQQVTRRSQVALVDLGWGGTIHKSLQVLLLKIAPATRLTGYYMATFPEAPHSVLPDVAVRSYLAHRGEPSSVYRQITSFLNLFETVYSSAQGSVLYFQRSPKATKTSDTPVEVAAVRQAGDKSLEQCRNMKAIHDGVLAFVVDFKRCTDGFSYPPMSAEVASEEFFRVIDKPTTEEAYLLGGLVHCDNLGSSSTHISARLRATNDPSELLEDYREVHWKQGVLSLPVPEVAALRTLLWLLETQQGAV